MSRHLPANLPRGHVFMPAAAIGSLAMVLAAGLAAFGLLDRIDRAVAATVSVSGTSLRPIPPAIIWLGAAVVSYLLALAMLGSPGTWRRVVLWSTTVMLMAAWAPVLVLAARQPAIAAWLVAATWSGACSFVYARNHRMPGEQRPSLESKEASAA